MTAIEDNDDLPGAGYRYRPGCEKVTFVVTGVDRSGRRFRQEYPDHFTADCINLFRGSVWEQSPNGKRRLLKRVYNI